MFCRRHRIYPRGWMCAAFSPITRHLWKMLARLLPVAVYTVRSSFRDKTNAAGFGFGDPATTRWNAGPFSLNTPLPCPVQDTRRSS